MLHQNHHHDEPEIETFLISAREQGDESLRLAAAQLLRFFRERYRDLPSMDGTAVILPIQENEQPSFLLEKVRHLEECMNELEEYLQDATSRGKSALPDIKRRVKAFQQEFPEFRKKLPVGYLSTSFHASDQSWVVVVTREGLSPFYQLEVIPVSV